MRTLIPILCMTSVVCGQDLDDLVDDDMSLMIDLDGMSKKEVQQLADKILKSSKNYSVEAAIGVLSHENLMDSERSARLYRMFKSRVKPEHFEILDESPLLRQGFTDPVIAGLLIKLAGITRAPGARRVVIDAFKQGPASYRAAGAEAIGHYGAKEHMRLLRRAYEHYKSQPHENQIKEYGDGIIRGLLLFGDSQHLAGLLKEAAIASREVAEAVLTIASGYTPPVRKHQAKKRLPGKRARHTALMNDIIDLAPLFPKEMASLVQSSIDPDVCDVLYRRLPLIVSRENYRNFIPAVKAKNWDLRQLILDLLTSGLASSQDLAEIRLQILDLYKGGNGIDRAWAIRNSGILSEAERVKLLAMTIKNGTRWDRMEAVKEIRRKPSKHLMALLKDHRAELTDPDVQFHLSRVLMDNE